MSGVRSAVQQIDSHLFHRLATILGKTLSSIRLDAEVMKETNEGKPELPFSRLKIHWFALCLSQSLVLFQVFLIFQSSFTFTL